MCRWDFCKQSDGDPNQYYTIPIDDNFVNNYVAIYTNADHRPQYVFEVVNISGVWHIYFYSPLSQKYVDVSPWTSAVGYPMQPAQNGWSMFETHFNYNVAQPYPQQECPSLPNLGASGIRTSSDGATWSYLTSTAQFYVNNSRTPAQCFSPNDGQNDYILNHEPTDPNDEAWVVNSSQNMRNPDAVGIRGSAGMPPGGGGAGGGGGQCHPKCLLGINH